MSLRTIYQNIIKYPIQWLSWIAFIIILAVSHFYDNKTADFINKSSLTIVSRVTQVNNRYIYYKFNIDEKQYKSSFKIKKEYQNLLSGGDKLFVRYAIMNPEINYCIYPELRNANQFPFNMVLDTLNSKEISGGWIGNNPHNHYTK